MDIKKLQGSPEKQSSYGNKLAVPKSGGGGGGDAYLESVKEEKESLLLNSIYTEEDLSFRTYRSGRHEEIKQKDT